ncbi:MAG: ribonuclease HII [Patescibacteria group bacterium]|jgi:ribonuclease HII
MELILPTTFFEQKTFLRGVHFIIGCDEVGRGCLAGPVVAGAVFFDWSKPEMIEGLRGRVLIADSKTLTELQREESDEAIRGMASGVGIGVVRVETIDERNILQASLLAMRKAVATATEGLVDDTRPFVFVDGNQRIPYARFDQETVIGGDGKVFSIAAASIVAKVYRDALMKRLHKRFPVYHWDENAGYGTPAHRTAIREHGLTPFHRTSFKQL